MLNEKLGFYTCDNINFQSKIQALLHSKNINKPVSWYFNDREFTANQWTTEPPCSLDFYYDLRTKELREKYDYLILSYSGGSDSHNILTSFIRQKLHIDEIIVFHMNKGNNKHREILKDPFSSSNLNSEVDIQCLPRLKEYEKFLDKTKITIIDLTDHVFDLFESAGDESWVVNKIEGLNPIGVSRYNYIYLDKVRKQFDKNKTIGLILGIDKPKSLIKNGNFYLRFNDRTTNQGSIVSNYQDYTNTSIEYFYWDPSCLDLLTKQGHVIKRWLEANPQYIKYWDIKQTSLKLVKLTHESLLRSVLYTTWNDEWFQVSKPSLDWYSENDKWFIEGEQGTRAHEIWKRGVDYIKDNLSSFVRYDPETSSPDGLVSFVKEYCIGSVKINSQNTF
jgi:hypothetical protein